MGTDFLTICQGATLHVRSFQSLRFSSYTHLEGVVIDTATYFFVWLLPRPSPPTNLIRTLLIPPLSLSAVPSPPAPRPARPKHACPSPPSSVPAPSTRAPRLRTAAQYLLHAVHGLLQKLHLLVLRQALLRPEQLLLLLLQQLHLVPVGIQLPPEAVVLLFKRIGLGGQGCGADRTSPSE